MMDVVSVEHSMLAITAIILLALHNGMVVNGFKLMNLPKEYYTNTASNSFKITDT